MYPDCAWHHGAQEPCLAFVVWQSFMGWAATRQGGQVSFGLSVVFFLVSLRQPYLTLAELWCVAARDVGLCLLKVTDWICSRCPLQNGMSTAAERGKNRKKSPLEFTLKHGAVKPGVIISQQCFGPLSGLTAPGLQAALLNAAADLLQMLNRHISIICQQYNSPLLPSGLQTHMVMCGFHEKWSTPASGSIEVPMLVSMTESLDDKHTLERSNCPSQSPLNLVADVIAIFF